MHSIFISKLMKADTQKQVDIHNNNNDWEINLKYSVSYLVPSVPGFEVLGTIPN